MRIPMQVRCGRCVGCRLERSRQWAVRIMHEAQMHDRNCFVTLTYADEHVPEHGSLDKEAFPLFMKRLRKRFDDRRIRYFHAGEYGEKSGRPHYHGCLFGIDFSEDRVFLTHRGEHKVYRSPTLEKLWPFGFSEIGSLTFESAQYCARYILKKAYGDRAKWWYMNVHPETGEIREIEPEYTTMSLRPGIGREWFEEYWSDVFPSDEVIVNGRSSKPPRYYLQLLESQAPLIAKEVKRRRREEFDRAEGRPDRLRAQETCTEARLSLTGRPFDAES